MKEISPQEAYELMQRDPEIIYLDVRSVPEFEAGHAPGAINIPLKQLDAATTTDLDKRQAIVVYCWDGL